MKKFVVKYGGYIVNIIAFLTLIGVIVSSISVMMNQGFWAGLISLWAGIVGFVIAFFMIFLVMSVNEHLAEICEKICGKI